MTHSRPQTQPKLLTMDILVLATMKNAAKCDTQCELQNSVNHQNFERILRSEVFLRACLSQWHLPLSPCGFFSRQGGRIASRPRIDCSISLSLQEQSWPAWRHIELSCAERSVVVGCAVWCIPSDRCRCCAHEAGVCCTTGGDSG